MKIKTKVKAGRGCGGTPDIQSGHTTQRPHNPGTPATARAFPSKETIMKIKTKVKAGSRDCGGGKLPVATDVQSNVIRRTSVFHLDHEEWSTEVRPFPQPGDHHEDQDQGQGRPRLRRQAAPRRGHPLIRCHRRTSVFHHDHEGEHQGSHRPRLRRG